MAAQGCLSSSLLLLLLLACPFQERDQSRRSWGTSNCTAQHCTYPLFPRISSHRTQQQLANTSLLSASSPLLSSPLFSRSSGPTQRSKERKRGDAGSSPTPTATPTATPTPEIGFGLVTGHSQRQPSRPPSKRAH
ncbi:hypothetical protein ONS95_014623 [Cadophora gregata]|uniref:uncharacterized protein n=1 Tax=Cadophora gregata TaxID=51156 RepID=UPI0026DD2A87|nr:uncharacterized protein ONS95_014623 [Cadophora gregata]KAK0112904.1 hypothetical protein ONS95_014623 [Cadophora gregata]KAK0125030.1 hypothetical protein ONS96_008896 [Cadophora gregata f. sp. sojae]